jgi:aminoglycoside phosphotransferase (APT) family kinase protein
MTEVGPLLAQGRECDVYEYGPTMVLRRARSGYSLEPEARVMEFVRTQGYPVPVVHDLLDDGRDMVLERVVGRALMDEIQSKPWTMVRQARTLADLHKQLHAIDAPDWLPRYDDGRSIVHRDLHPLNVLVGPRGPMVIDWANAARAHGEVDVADAWLLIASGVPDNPNAVMRVLLKLRTLLVEGFVREFDRAAIVPYLRHGMEMRTLDHNMRPAEIDAMRRLVAKEEAKLRKRQRTSK